MTVSSMRSLRSRLPLFGTRTHPIYWVPIDGAWKLSNASACVIATQVAGTDCTV